jgi:hypothetical protein
MKKNETPKKQPDFIIYETDNHIAKVSARLEEETVWLTQAHLVELFQSSKANISEHIKHVFEEGELNENLVVRNFRTTASDGKNYGVAHYEIYRQREMRQLESDFDRAVKQLTQKNNNNEQK